MINRKFVPHRRVLSIALPMLLVGISTPLLGMVDTAVVGHLAEPFYLGAIAIGAMIFNFLFWGMGFLRMGTTGLTARAVGERDPAETTLILFRGLLLALLLGLTLILFGSVISQIVFFFIETSGDVLFHAQRYFEIRIWAAPATLGSYVLLGWFLGQGKPRFNLVLVVAVNLLNIILDIVFVIWLDMSSAGVAWATLIAEYLGLFIGLYIVRHSFKVSIRNLQPSILFNLPALKRYLTVNVNVFLRTIFLLLGFAVFTLQGAKYGEVMLAANVILMNLQTLMAYMLDSLAHAAEVLVGKYYHGNKRQKLRELLIVSGQWSFIVAIIFAALYAIAGEYVIAMLTSISDVKEMALKFLPWLILSPLVSVWSYWFDGVFIGANLMKQMRNTMLISLLIFLASWQLLLPFENHGLWAALMIFMLARGITMGLVAYQQIRKPG
ncbi:MAG: MATE family efflux transporter [Gammaproteobacteria bacterium]|nr:MATE family efflux transporter [Gammaproteobacteria bacterium]